MTCAFLRSWTSFYFWASSVIQNRSSATTMGGNVEGQINVMFMLPLLILLDSCFRVMAVSWKGVNMERIVQLEISFTISSQNSWEIYSKILYLQLTNSLKLLDLGSRKSCKVTYTLDLWKIMLIRKYLWLSAQGLRCPNCHWAYCWHHEVLFSMLQHLWLVLFWGFFFSLCYPI